MSDLGIILNSSSQALQLETVNEKKRKREEDEGSISEFNKSDNVNKLQKVIAKLSIVEKRPNQDLTCWPWPTTTDLTELVVLNLSNNRLTEIPNVIGCASRLQQLNLSNNQLTVIPLMKFRSLRVLHLSKNRFIEIPRFIQYATSLQEINLSHNLICYKSESQNSGKKHNDIFREDGENWLIDLDVLDISHNLLKEIPESIPSLNLRQLSINNNDLSPNGYCRREFSKNDFKFLVKFNLGEYNYLLKDLDYFRPFAETNNGSDFTLNGKSLCYYISGNLGNNISIISTVFSYMTVREMVGFFDRFACLDLSAAEMMEVKQNAYLNRCHVSLIKDVNCDLIMNFLNLESLNKMDSLFDLKNFMDSEFSRNFGYKNKFEYSDNLSQYYEKCIKVISNLKSVTSLDLSDWYSVAGNEGLEQKKGISIGAMSTKCRFLRGFSLPENIKNLQNLRLGNCRITRKDKIPNTKNLELFNVTIKKSRIPFSEGIESIKLVGGNKLEGLQSVKFPESLKKLYLHSEKITDANFPNLPTNLEVLSLDWTFVEGRCLITGFFPKLKFLSLHGCPIQSNYLSLFLPRLPKGLSICIDNIELPQSIVQEREFIVIKNQKKE